MIRSLLKYAFVFLLVILSGAMLMDVTRQVQDIENKIARVDREIELEREAVRVLKAEWAYLNDPARLDTLVSDGLDMGVPSVEGLVSTPDILPDNEYFDPLSSVPPGEQRDASVVSPYPPVKPHYTPNANSPLFVKTSVGNNSDGGRP